MIYNLELWTFNLISYCHIFFSCVTVCTKIWQSPLKWRNRPMCSPAKKCSLIWEKRYEVQVLHTWRYMWKSNRTEKIKENVHVMTWDNYYNPHARWLLCSATFQSKLSITKLPWIIDSD